MAMESAARGNVTAGMPNIRATSSMLQSQSVLPRSNRTLPTPGGTSGSSAGPTRMLDAGFTFEFPTWPEVAKDVYARRPGGRDPAAVT